VSGFVAATNHRLLGGWPDPIREPLHEWSTDAPTLAARGMELWQNDPFAQAMVTARQLALFGAEGLQFRSLYEIDGTALTTGPERDARRQINDAIMRAGMRFGLDAQRCRSRLALEKELDCLACVQGDAFAIRRLLPGRKNASHMTCWRIIPSYRVSNPDNRPSGGNLYEGIELDDDMQPIALHVMKGRLGQFGYAVNAKWERIPWTAEDGTPNVIHRVGWRLPGMIRGVSMFAPLILLSRQIAGTVEAHVAGKRAQACQTFIIKTQDAEELAEADRDGAKLGPHTRFQPVTVAYVSHENEVVLPQNKFEGSDLKEFLDANRKPLCAAWGLPIEVVLAMMGEASLASARAGLDHFNRVGRSLQNEHIEQCASLIDESIIREEVAVGRFVPNTDDWSRIMAGDYKRPSKFVTDPIKEAQAVKAEIEIGRAPSMAFSERGWDYESETEQKMQDAEFLQIQAAGARETTARGDLAVMQAEQIARIQQKCEELNAALPGLGLHWAQLMTLEGAKSAPGAYLAAVTGSKTATGPDDAEPKPEAQEDQDEPAAPEPADAESEEVPA
jgi:capsid protein